MEIKESINCKGLECPMPMIKLVKAIKGLNSGEILEMLGTDPGTKSDLKRWCDRTGHIILEINEAENGIFRFLIQKI